MIQMQKKEIVVENIFTRERYQCRDLKDVQKIDGVDYLKVSSVGSQRIVLMRRDSLKKVTVV